MTSSGGMERADLDRTLLREVDGWTYHVANLDQDAELQLQTFDHLHGPPGLGLRFDALQDVLGESVTEVTIGVFTAPERLLTPRRPYQAAPLSYLNALNGWHLSGEFDQLQWTGDPSAAPELHIRFWNVVPGTTALITLRLTVGTGDPPDSGTILLQDSDGNNRLIPVTGFKALQTDVVVRPQKSFAGVLVHPASSAVKSFGFRSVTYRTL